MAVLHATDGCPSPLALPLRRTVLAVLLSMTAAGAAPARESPNATSTERRELTVPIAARSLLLDAALAGNAVVAVGDHGAIIRSIDSGRSWTPVAAPLGATLTGIAFEAKGVRGWAVGHEGRILATHDGGLTWNECFRHASRDAVLLDVFVLDQDQVLAVGAFGLALESKDGGITWSELKLPSEDLHLNRISKSAQGTALVAGESGTLLTRARGDTQWHPVEIPYDGSFYGFVTLSDGRLAAHGLRGHLFVATPPAGPKDQAEWQKCPVPSTGMLSCIIELGSGTLIAGGPARQLFISRDKGATWSHWQTPLVTAIAELLIAPDGTLLAFGEAGVTVLPAP